MKGRKKRKQQPSVMRVGAMQRPRDVAPDRVPVQFIMPGKAAPQECDLDARIIAAVEGEARKEGKSLERTMESVLCLILRDRE